MQKYAHWTDYEKEQLANMVQKYTVNGRVQWDCVAQHFSNRSKQQIKSFYINRLCPTAKHQPKDQQQTSWTKPKLADLYFCVNFYNFDWKTVRNNYF